MRPEEPPTRVVSSERTSPHLPRDPGVERTLWLALYVAVVLSPLALMFAAADFLEFEPLTQPNFIVRLKQEQTALRMIVTRINTIRETSFVGAGYLICEITSVLLVISLLLADIAPLGAELFLLGTITFLLTYMILLIKDLDDPFEYDENGRVGAAEVSLAPLHYLEDRIAKEHEALASEPSSAAAR